MTPIDWAVLGVYLVAILVVGAWAGRGNRALDDFFLAGREMRWWAVGLSVMATQISAITFIGTTGQAYTDGMRFLVVYFGLPFAMVLLCLTLVPFFYRARVFTAYEYLERRFDVRTRTLTSLLFLAGRGLAMGVTLYAPALVMSVILGWSESATILLMGGSTIAYVLYGGSRSVIWTDVIQMAIIWIGIFVCLGVAIVQLPEAFSLRDALALAQSSGRLDIVNLDPRPSTPYTLWSGLIGGLFLALAYFGTDQSQVQRYLAGSSLTQSRLSLLFNAFLKVPMQFVILLTGVLVFVFYHFQPAPLLWNASALAGLRASAPAAEVQALEADLRVAEARRAASARAFAAARQAGQAPDTAAYLASQAHLDEVRAQARARWRMLNAGAPYNDTNYIFPTYVLTHVPKGLAGLVIAVIFAAAMSTLSGEFNSVATATMIDFYKRFVRPGSSDAHDLLVSRLFTAAWGGFACLVALRAGALGSAIEAVNRLGSLVYGPILGVFLVAILFRKANGDDALAGLVIGEIVVVCVALFTNVHFLWHNVVGALAVLVAAFAWHVITGGRLRRAPAH
jgi:Na+/proline symporter